MKTLKQVKDMSERELLEELAEYVIECTGEGRDYENSCYATGKDINNYLESDHIYAVAVIARKRLENWKINFIKGKKQINWEFLDEIGKVGE